MSSAGAAMTRAPVGVYGGSFDPVHHGHLRAALEVVSECRLASLRLVPCGQPPHRAAPVAPAAERLRMLRAAVSGEPRLAVDDRELRRAGPSYTVDTLRELRAELPPGTPLCLVLGADAFLGLPGWRRWQELPELAHLIVMQRPGTALSPQGELAALLALRRREDPAALAASPAGVVLVRAITQLDIASSAIRALLARGGDPRYLVPDPVRDMMINGGYYKNTAEVQARA